MSIVALLSSALITSYSAFPKSIPLAVESLLAYHLLRLHREIFCNALTAWIPFLPIIRSFLGTLVIFVMRVSIWVLSRCFQFLQDIMISVALRKRYFHDRVTGRIRQGTRQVLVLGAGYDALAPMLAEIYPTVLFVEIDRPDMSNQKRNIISKTGKRLDNLVFAGVNLFQDRLEDRLLKEVPKWNISEKSVVIAENLLMYFEPEAVRRVMHSIKQLTPSNTMVVFSYAQKESELNFTCLTSQYFPKTCKWVANDAEEVASIIEDDEFYAELAPHESDLYKKYLRDNPFGITNHPFFRNAYGMAMSR